MGNCLESCFGSVRKSKTSYFTGRYKEYNVGIEFESLIEDDLAQQADSNMVTDRERDHLLNKRYSDLMKDQKRRDAEIEAELKGQEENVRLEEEAYNAAKRESGRAALQARALEQQRSRPRANGMAKSSWLGENESDWNVAGGEDDFEMFLESVKARSQTVRANVTKLSRQREGHTDKLTHKDSSTGLEWDYEKAGLAAIPYQNTESSNIEKHPLLANMSPSGNSAGSVSTQDASSEQIESDTDWDPDFVGASTNQVFLSSDGLSSPSENTNHMTEVLPASSNSLTETPIAESNNTKLKAEVHEGKSATVESVDTTAPVIDKKVEPTSHMTQSTNVQSVNIPDELDVIVAPENTSNTANNATSTQTTKMRTETSEKASEPAAVTEDDPFDFDKFLEELDLEG